jgi:hypothetical protein
VQALFFVVMFASMQGALVGAVMIWRKSREAAAERSVAPPAAVNESVTDAAAAGPPPAQSSGAAESAALPAAAEPPGSAFEDDWTPDPHHIPFGPFLALAAVEQLLAGDAIWAGWMGLMNHLWDLIDKLAGRA